MRMADRMPHIFFFPFVRFSRPAVVAWRSWRSSVDDDDYYYFLLCVRVLALVHLTISSTMNLNSILFRFPIQFSTDETNDDGRGQR